VNESGPELVNAWGEVRCGVKSFSDHVDANCSTMNTEIDVNPYELLDVKIESTDQEIRTAYRQRSLKVHPDRVRA
jgi:DnaJ-class molecular chaperone